jgi:DNA-binding transcriptional ArsR family regulator
VKTNARVYVMLTGPGEVKVGLSRDPERRARQLGGRISLAHQTEVIGPAEEVERTAHRILRMSGRRSWGERFKVSTEEAVAAIDRAQRIVSGREPSLPDRIEYPDQRTVRVHLPRETDDEVMRIVASRKLGESYSQAFRRLLCMGIEEYRRVHVALR